MNVVLPLFIIVKCCDSYFLQYSLARCGIGVQGAKTLGEALKHVPQLQTLKYVVCNGDSFVFVIYGLLSCSVALLHN